MSDVEINNNLSDNNIKVMVRVRPMLERELSTGCKTCINLNLGNKSMIIIQAKPE